MILYVLEKSNVGKVLPDAGRVFFMQHPGELQDIFFVACLLYHSSVQESFFICLSREGLHRSSMVSLV